MALDKTSLETTTADAASVDIYGEAGIETNAFDGVYESPDESMQATIDGTMTRAESGTTGATTEEATDPAYDDYETRNAARNHVGVDDHSYLSSDKSASTEGASASTDQTTSTEGETTVDEHYNELFADAKYGSVDDMKYS